MVDVQRDLHQPLTADARTSQKWFSCCHRVISHKDLANPYCCHAWKKAVPMTCGTSRSHHHERQAHRAAVPMTVGKNKSSTLLVISLPHVFETKLLGDQSWLMITPHEQCI
jgi:hypothetical protein